MPFFQKLFVACGLLFLCSCEVTKNQEPEIDFPDYNGLIRIDPPKDGFYLGSNSDLVGEEAKPRFRVKLDYSFFLSPNEVTQGEFMKVMGYNPSFHISDIGELPVENVNWFEAVLYCNKLSNEQFLDTVYSYQRSVLGDNGRVVDLVGVQANFKKEGYRLPTEAEWVYGSSPSGKDFPWGNQEAEIDEMSSHGWINLNSEDKSHPVQKKTPNDHGLYDMVGNVMEWVHDWKIPFDSKDKQNFVGLDAKVQEKVVKGGSFIHPWSSASKAARRDVYAVPPGQRTRYLGFRVAAGAFEVAEEQSINVKQDVVFPEILPTRVERVDFFKTFAVKLSFINKNWNQLLYSNLNEMDFFYSWDHEEAIRHPEFSPNGENILYGTGQEGFEEPGHFFLVNTKFTEENAWKSEKEEGAIGRWFVNPASLDTSIIYANHGGDNETAENQRTWKVPFRYKDGFQFEKKTSLENGLWHSGISKGGEYFASGYKKLKILDRKTNTVLDLFTGSLNGKQNPESDQVCNVSVAPDHSGDHAFIDFGSLGNSSIVGRPYGILEFIFIGDVEGRVKKTFLVPDGFVGWNHVEYTNHPDYLVATSTLTSGENSMVWAIRISDSTYLPLAEGKDLWQPTLWLGKGFEKSMDLPLDSVTQYGLPLGSFERKEIARKMFLFWDGLEEHHTYVMGSSRVLNGFNPLALQDSTGYLNFGLSAANLYTSKFLMSNYVLPHAKEAKHIVVGIDLDNLGNSNIEYVTTHIEPSRGFAFDRSQNYHYIKPMSSHPEED